MFNTGTSQICRSNGGQCCSFRVESRLSFRNLFLRSSRESNEFFLRAASVISRTEITEVSMAGKRLLYQNKSENHAILKMFVDKQSFSRLLVDRDQYCRLFLHATLVRWFNLRSDWGSHRFYRAYVPVKLKLQHPPPPPLGIPRAFDAFSCLGGREFDHLSLPGGGAFDHLS